jgi:hypothetical protein
MRLSKVHDCVSQEMVAQGLEEPPAKKCRCRRKIEYKQADQMVKKGEARWVVVGRERGTQDQICTICGGDATIKNCANCGGKGKIVVAAVWETYNYDIVLVAQASFDLKEKKYRPARAMKTPRVATIESEHIERAYVEGVPEAAARIEEYGMLIVKEQLRQLAVGLSNEEFDAAWREYEDGKCNSPLPVPIRFEPENNLKTGEGRDCDYGRAV